MSTISTNRSRSPVCQRSRTAINKGHHGSHSRRRGLSPNRRRARGSSSSSSTVSYPSRSSSKRPSKERFGKRHDSRRRGSIRCDERKGQMMDGNSTRKRRRASSSSSRSYPSDYSRRRRPGNRCDDHERNVDRNTRRRHSSVSPDTRGRDRSPPRDNDTRRTMSRGDSMDRSRVARARRSMTPRSPPLQERANRRGHLVNSQVTNPTSHQDRQGNDSSNRYNGYRGRAGLENRQQRAPPSRKERSLSPFSKRLALTQAMNMGHR